MKTKNNAPIICITPVSIPKQYRWDLAQIYFHALFIIIVYDGIRKPIVCY